MNSLPQGSGIHASDDAPQTIGAAEGTTQPDLPELCGPRHPHSIQAPQSGPVDGQNCFYNQGSGDTRKRAVIGHPIEDSSGELKDLFRIADQASENGLTPFAPSSASIPNQKVLRSAVPSLAGCERLPGYVLPSAGAQTAGAVFRHCGEPATLNMANCFRETPKGVR